MNFRRTFVAAAAIAAFGSLATAPAAAQQVIKLTAAAGHPPVFLWVKTADEVLIPRYRQAAGCCWRQVQD